MKPFDLERALAGDPVVTRRGDVATDFHMFWETGTTHPLFCVIGRNICAYTNNGSVFENTENPFDLFMAPKKRTVWINFSPEMIASAYCSKEAADHFAKIDRFGNRAYEVEVEE